MGQKEGRMVVLFKSRDYDTYTKLDYRSAVEITIDGDFVFGVCDGEPEDSNLGRDFSDVFKIPRLMQMAYDAGKIGDDFSIVIDKSSEI